MDPDQVTKAEQIIDSEVNAVSKDSSRIKRNSCAACHVLFTLVDGMQLNESEAADMLTEVLLEKPELNDRFIDMVEKIHMKERMQGALFAIKTRESKDRYIDSQFRNSLDELLGDAANYGVEIVLRKLIMANVALQIAQNLGIDYHAATEELYYYMRKNDQATHEQLMELIASLLSRSARK
ncbi:MAG: hypothetical protein DA330_04005 [Nitrososphaera sp.]|nr:hypothetical protein [Nitrososphaera sp.]